MLRRERAPPVVDHMRVLEDVADGHGDHDRVEHEEDRDHHDGDVDGLLEAAEEHDREADDEDEGDRHLLALEPVGGERVLDGVRTRIRSAEGDGDHEVGRGEAQQHEHHELAAPPGQQLLEHGDRALAAVALARDAAVDREGAAEGHEHEHDRGDGAQQARGEGRDGGLVAEGREVVDAREAHDAPPRVRLLGLRGTRPRMLAGLLGAVGEPVREAALDLARGRRITRREVGGGAGARGRHGSSIHASSGLGGRGGT